MPIETQKPFKIIPQGKFGIATEGYSVIAIFAFSSLIFALIEAEVFSLFFLLGFAFSMHFFRDPERIAPTDQSLAVSPADGKIIRIQQMQDPITQEMKTCISIFMNVFSVHVNRVPVNGVIQKITYIPGKFFNASLDKASTDNERCAYSFLDEKENEWTFVQISGLIARRIVSHVQEQDNLKRGSRFGLIRFGSRVDIYLPSSYATNLQIGDQVYAGETPIAKPKD